MNNKYYKMRQYRSEDGGVTWIPTDVYTAGALIERASIACNPIERWVEDGWICDDCPEPRYRTISGTPYCSGMDGVDKWVEVFYQKSYDNGVTWITISSEDELVEEKSYDCGYRERTTSGTPYCTGYDKYRDVYNQVSIDGGETWTTTASTNVLIEADSEDCGYVPPAPTNYKWLAEYSDSHTESAQCDSTSAITSNEIDRSIVSVQVGDCVTNIDFGAFATCSGLTSVTIGSNVTTIGNNAFMGCSFSSITIPSSVTTISQWAFGYCSGLTSIDIPDTVTSLGYAAFDGCTNLLNANVGSGVTSIEGQLFGSCSSLTSVTIPDSVTSIGLSSFNGCTSLTSIDIPSGVTSIDSSAFSGCRSLSVITIPNSVTSIGRYAFQDCSGLTSINIGSGVTSIGGYAFHRCSGLTSLTINAITPPTLEREAFSDTNDCPIYVPCQSVDAYKSASGWSNYASRIQCVQPPYSAQYLTFVSEESGTMIFTPSSSNTIYYSTDSGSTWTQDNSVNVTSGDSVMWKGTMTPIERDPTYMTGIGAFSATCRFHVEGNPMSLLFGDNFEGQTSLVGKDYAFAALFSMNSTITSAENMALPATTLAPYCYYSMFWSNSGLTAIPTLPATTLASHCYCGMFGGCTSLTTIPSNYLLATTLAEGCYDGMFASCSSLTTVPTLPATTLADNCYKSMFASCSSLTTAPELPSLTLGDMCYYNMFNGCTSLTTAPVLSATTLVNGCYATMFNGCTSLNYVKCLATDISASYCTYHWLNNVASSGTFIRDCNTNWSSGNSGIPSGWTDNCTPPTPTFDGKWLATYSDSHTESAECDSSSAITNGEIDPENLVTVEIGDCVANIDYSAFEYYTSLSSVTIPDSVTSIDEYAFEYCSGLTNVTIGSGITSIGNYAFGSCRRLTSITVEATTPPSLGDNVFYNTNNCPIYVPAASVSAYQSAWSDYASRIQAIP